MSREQLIVTKQRQPEVNLDYKPGNNGLVRLGRVIPRVTLVTQEGVSHQAKNLPLAQPTNSVSLDTKKPTSLLTTTRRLWPATLPVSPELAKDKKRKKKGKDFDGTKHKARVERRKAKRAAPTEADLRRKAQEDARKHSTGRGKPNSNRKRRRQRR